MNGLGQVVRIVCCGLRETACSYLGRSQVCAVLVQKKCIECHTHTILEISHYTRQEWKIIISRMIDYGVKLNNRQINELVDYLTRLPSPDNG